MTSFGKLYALVTARNLRKMRKGHRIVTRDPYNDEQRALEDLLFAIQRAAENELRSVKMRMYGSASIQRELERRGFGVSMTVRSDEDELNGVATYIVTW